MKQLEIEITVIRLNTVDLDFPQISQPNQIKHLFSTDNMPCHFTAGFAAGFCTTIIASPVDVVKTRYMNSVPGQYSGAINCAFAMLIREGPTAFYKGYAHDRIHTHKSCIFIMVEKSILEELFFFIDLDFFSFRFIPSFLRLGSWNIVMFVSYEQIKRAVVGFQQYSSL